MISEKSNPPENTEAHRITQYTYERGAGDGDQCSLLTVKASF